MPLLLYFDTEPDIHPFQSVFKSRRTWMALAGLLHTILRLPLLQVLVRRCPPTAFAKVLWELCCTRLLLSHLLAPTGN